MTAIEIAEIADAAEAARQAAAVAASAGALTSVAGGARTDQDSFAQSLALGYPGAGALDELVCERLSAAGRLDAVVAWERLVRHAHAGLVHALSALVHVGVEDPRGRAPDGADGESAASGGGAASRLADADGMDLAEMEVCAALAWSPTYAQERLIEADVLTRVFPATLKHLSGGAIAVEQARGLVQLTGGLEDAAAREVEGLVIARMPGQRLALTRQAVRRAIVRVDPESAGKRHRYKRARRRVELIPEDDGMATLSFYLPADVAQMAMRTLTELAHSAKRKNKSGSDKRTLDQRRADLLPVLLHHAATGGSFAAGATPNVLAQVNVVVGIETLLGLSHEPGQLQGYGPICPEQTRRIARAHAARWRFVLTASDGTPVDASRTYTPSAALKRLTQLRYGTCAFPNCIMPAERCDIDHNQPHHKGGPTSVENLAPLCRTHHNAKSFGHWRLAREGDLICWKSARTGREYTTAPTRYQPAPMQPTPGHATSAQSAVSQPDRGRPALTAG